MNGVRRFLAGGGAGTNTAPPPNMNISANGSRSSLSSRSPSPTKSDFSSTKDLPPPPSASASGTQGLFIRKDRKPPPPVAGPSSSGRSSPAATMSSPRRKAPPSEWDAPGTQRSPSIVAPPANTRDALLLSLLSSEAMVDSRGYEILSAEEVDELKKATRAVARDTAAAHRRPITPARALTPHAQEHTVLSARLGALQKKLATEMKIRDAAQTLARLNAGASPASSPSRIARQSSSALDTAARKVDTAQTELWRVQERAADAARRLLEHRAGVLGLALAEVERAHAPDAEGGGAPRFDGAHLFAGHEAAVVPGKPRVPAAAAATTAVADAQAPANREEVEALEAQVAALEARAAELEAELEDAQGAAALEVEDVRMAAADELEEVRMAAGEELARERAARQAGEARAAELEGRVAALEDELEAAEAGAARGKDAGDGAAAALEDRVRTLERELADAKGGRAEADAAAAAAAAAWAVERASWAAERAQLEDAQAQTLAAERARWEQEREELAAQARDALADAGDALRGLVQRFDVPLFARGPGLGVLVDALARYLETHNAQTVAAEAEKRAALARELDAAREELKAHAAAVRPASLEPRPASPVVFARDAAGFAAILQPLWATLPSPEARAARLTSAARPFRAGSSGRTSPSLRAGAGAGPNSPSPSAASISDMDVRALKSLYSPGGGAGAGTPGSPRSPVDGGGTFSVEAFAARVQALIADDRALMERLIRFAQAHDLLKKNAERAQKLAQESNGALETYQRQVRALEERLARGGGMQDQFEQLAAEKLAVEERAAEQAETLRQLTEANASLSARALQLAADAAAAQAELRAVNAASEREQAQRLALLEEINLVQTENSTLRQQLRALGKL
ncbi:Up-regulated during septation-domain-containing protein [Gloeopeniophorella convolvens]|nr:Up-regulated during septation-domain-containing protein [Gloeopeniophorella convolvens]